MRHSAGSLNSEQRAAGSRWTSPCVEIFPVRKHSKVLRVCVCVCVLVARGSLLEKGKLDSHLQKEGEREGCPSLQRPAHFPPAHGEALTWSEEGGPAGLSEPQVGLFPLNSAPDPGPSLPSAAPAGLFLCAPPPPAPAATRSPAWLGCRRRRRRRAMLSREPSPAAKRALSLFGYLNSTKEPPRLDWPAGPLAGGRRLPLQGHRAP